MAKVTAKGTVLPPDQNVAWRLHNLFAQVADADGHKQTVKVWQEAFNLPPEVDNPLEVFARLSQVDEALNDVEAIIRENSGAAAGSYLRYFDQLRHVIRSKNLEGDWSGLKSKLPKEVVYSLEMCAHAVPNEPSGVKDEIRQIFSQLDSLSEYINSSSFPPKLRQWLLETLADVRRAVEDYRILGRKKINEALVRLTGEMMVHYDSISDIEKSDLGFVANMKGLASSLLSVGSQLGDSTALIPYASVAVQFLQGTTSAIPFLR